MDSENWNFTVLHQTTRTTVGNFDSILASLLTQGNTFALAILSLPIVAKLTGWRAALLSFLGFIFVLFLLFANILYKGLLAAAVKAAEHIECNLPTMEDEQCLITTQLGLIPFSATRGSTFLYLGLPVMWLLVSLAEMIVFAAMESSPWLLVFVLLALLALAMSAIIYYAFLKQAQKDASQRQAQKREE